MNRECVKCRHRDVPEELKENYRTWEKVIFFKNCEDRKKDDEDTTLCFCSAVKVNWGFVADATNYLKSVTVEEMNEDLNLYVRTFGKERQITEDFMKWIKGGKNGK